MHPELLSLSLFMFGTSCSPGPNNIVDSFKAEAEALKRAEQKAEEQVLEDELDAFEAEFAAQQAKRTTMHFRKY